MKIKQFGAPSVSLSFNRDHAAETGRSAEISVLIKVEDREPEDAPLAGQVRFDEGEHLLGAVIERRSGNTWIVFHVAQELLPEGRPLALCALLDDTVVWQKDYRVAWHGRFPGLDPLSLAGGPAESSEL
jgi:hypothetical protein